MRLAFLWLALSGCSLFVDLDPPGEERLDGDHRDMDVPDAWHLDVVTRDQFVARDRALSDAYRDAANADGALLDAASLDGPLPDVELPDARVMRIPDAGVPDVAPDGPGCVDGDGDGRGEGCRAGPDCDDGLPEVWRVQTGFRDADGDGATAGAEPLCVGDALPDGYREAPSVEADCDDRDPAVWRLLGVWADADRDGASFGDEQERCLGDELPEGWLGAPSAEADCDDDDPAVWRLVSLWADADRDGISGEASEDQCVGDAAPDGWLEALSDPPDCDDGVASVHPGAPELCNGRDDDCDGEPSPWEVDLDGARPCASAWWLVTDDRVGAFDPESDGREGYGAARRLLEVGGVVVFVERLQQAELRAGPLSRVGVVLLTGLGSARDLRGIERDALRDWVRAGGRLLLLTTEGQGFQEADQVFESLPGAFGIEIRRRFNTWGGAVAPALPDHPLMRDVAAMRVSDSASLRASDPAEVVAAGAEPFVIAAEVDAGRVVGFSAGGFLQNEGSGPADLAGEDHRQLWLNTVEWLVGGPWPALPGD